MRKLETIVCLLFLVLQVPAQSQFDRNFEVARNIDIFSSVCKELEMFYVDTLNTTKVVRTGIDAMLRELDPYTVYYSEEDMDDLKMMTTGKYAGIGSVIRLYKKDWVVIAEPYEGSPAARAGLKAGDILLDIDGTDLKGKNTTEVSSMLRGEPQTSFLLKVRRPGVEKPLSFKITRETIATPAVPYYGMVTPEVGYINLSGFTENSSTIVRRAFVDLRGKGAKSLVLDLRDNGGGLLGEAVEIVNLFVPKGKLVVKTVGKVKSTCMEYKTQHEPLDLQMPLAVLVNGNTASASEIVSGALQDMDRAVVIGDRTFGKGLVQSPRDLPYNGSIKLTTSKYYIPSGRCIQAIDYKHRDGDGRAVHIADSLTRVFHTEAGREVRDGGGIRPDIEVKLDTLANISAYLAIDDVLFDYATAYCQKHKTIPPADRFEVTDADFEEFCRQVKSSEFKYDKQTEKALKTLREIAGFEGYLEGASAEFEALEKKLTHDMDYDLQLNRKDIKKLLADEIIKRYYYQAGSVQQALKDDPVLERAKAVLADDAAYREILTKKEGGAE